MPHPIATRNAGFGLGLRSAHYADFLDKPQPLDWLEIITDNYLVEGGKPLAVLDAIRRDYPVAMHGVAMSVGSAQGLDTAYLQRVKALAERIEPLWVSDHLCWTGPGPQVLHDLYPLPYTDESARHVVAQIRRAQDLLGRRLVIENVSSYIRYQSDMVSEWQYLAHVAQEADCLLLVDVNNIYVSSVNHGFDPLEYLNALPAHRVQQIHLAGHSDKGDHIIDTHDYPVAQPVWDLYAHACQHFGAVAAMIERDDHIPPLAELLQEIDQARRVAAENTGAPARDKATTPQAVVFAQAADARALPCHLRTLQRSFATCVLTERRKDDAPAAERLDAEVDTLLTGRFGIYHHAYRARLAEALADTYAKTYLYLGSDLFDEHARAYAVAEPPLVRSLNRYGESFVHTLRTCYEANPELHELAQLDWDLRTRFDGPDIPTLDADGAQRSQAWVTRRFVLQPGVLLRTVTTNVLALWNAIHQNEEVPEAARLPQPAALLVWRKGHQPHFQTLDGGLGRLLQLLHEGTSLEATCAALQESAFAPDPAVLAQWIGHLVQEGLLRADTENNRQNPPVEKVAWAAQGAVAA